MEKKDVVIKYKNYIYLLGIVIACLCCVYKLWRFDITSMPLNYTQDGMFSLALMKLIAEDRGLGYVSDCLAGGFGFQMYDFNTAAVLLNIIKKIIAVLIPNYILAHNIYYFSGFVFVAWTSYYVLTKMDVDEMVAVVLAVLYTFMPYHLERGEAHINLGFYVFVPFVAYYARKFMMENENLPIKEHLIFAVSMLCIGMTGVYYAFFGCFFYAFTILYNVLHKRLSKNGIMGCIYIIIGGIIGGMPSLIYWMLNGKADSVGRTGADIATYSLQIPRLLLPITNHRIGAFAQIKEIYNLQYGYNETDNAALGIFYAITFVILLIVLIKKSELSDKLQEIAILNFAAIIYGVSGGFILIQGMVFTAIRCTNRISVYIGFFCCMALGIILTLLLQKVEQESRLKNIPYKSQIILAIILIIGLLDQTRANYLPDGDDTVESMMAEDEAFIDSIEELEEDGTMIYQLPYEQFPEAGTIENMVDYSHFVGFLYSDTLTWSYGSYRNTGGDVVNKKISVGCETTEMIENMIVSGYEGVFINTYGYAEEELLELRASMTEILEQEPLESQNGKYLYYSLADYIGKRDTMNDAETKARIYTGLEFKEGCFDEETNGVEYWRWMGKESEIKLYNYFDTPVSGIIEFSTKALCVDDLVITINEEEYIVPLNSECEIEIELQPGDNIMCLSTEADSFMVDGDSRRICYQFFNYKLDCNLENR